MQRYRMRKFTDEGEARKATRIQRSSQVRKVRCPELHDMLKLFNLLLRILLLYLFQYFIFIKFTVY